MPPVSGGLADAYEQSLTTHRRTRRFARRLECCELFGATHDNLQSTVCSQRTRGQWVSLRLVRKERISDCISQRGWQEQGTLLPMHGPSAFANPHCRRRWQGTWLLLVLCLSVSSGGATPSTGALATTLAQASDFRVRVSAALALGHTRDRRAEAALVRALQDGHPAVRAAAAAALGALGDRAAVVHLRAQAAREPRGPVRSEMLTTASSLEKRPGAHLLVRVGPVRNLTGPRAERLVEPLRAATRLRASELDGVEVVSDAVDAAEEGARRKLPVIMMDGALQRLSESRTEQGVALSADIEYAIRQIPGQSLKAMLKGTARVSGERATLADQAKLAELESDVVEGAVQSALRVDSRTMLALAR